MPSVHLTLFGTPGIASRSGPLDGLGTQGQPLALLAVLACAGERGIAREKLYALFWPDAASSRASHRLSQLLHHVRRGSACAGLVTGAAEVRLDPEQVTCDLWEWTAARRRGELERAVALYPGPFLDGFFLAGAPEFERWVESRRAALAREHLETLEVLAVQAEVRGDPRAAAAWWRRLGEQEPLSSRVTMHLMTALAASGERARALEQAQVYQAHMRTELEAEPNPAVGALAEQLRRSPPRPVALGILPLAPLDPEQQLRDLAEGLTEELMTAAAVPGLRVASRTAIATLREGRDDVREIGARLGLAAVLEGSVRRAAGRVRLTVRLVDTRDGCHLWTGRFERDLDDGFAGQDSLAREVVEAFMPSLAGLRSA